MTMTDPISDLLTRVRNGHVAKHDRVRVPSSKLKMAVCRILEREGYIDGFRVEEGAPSNFLDIRLRYDSQGVPAITKIQRVSKPGRRVYVGAEDIRPILNGIGTSIISTSSGLLTDQEAKTRGIGGEVLCELH